LPPATSIGPGVLMLTTVTAHGNVPSGGFRVHTHAFGG
jgi:hypothetical protein